MDPITIAAASFAAIKAGVAAGREIQELGKEIGKLWGAIDQARADHSSAQNSPFRGSTEEEAMDTFISLQKAKDFEDQLRSIIMETRGYGAWQELIKLRAEIKERKRKAELASQVKRRERLELIGKIILSLLGFGSVTGLIIIGVLVLQKQGIL
jgi:CHASE3 domain sensor protein